MSPGLKRLSVCLLGIVLPLLLAGSATAGLQRQNAIVSPPGTTVPANTCFGSNTSAPGQLTFLNNTTAFTDTGCPNNVVVANTTLFSTVASPATETISCSYSLTVTFRDNSFSPPATAAAVTISGTVAGSFNSTTNSPTIATRLKNTFDPATLALNGTSFQVGCLMVTLGTPIFTIPDANSGGPTPTGNKGNVILPISCSCTPLTCNPTPPNNISVCATSASGAAVTFTTPGVSIPGQPDAHVCLTNGGLSCTAPIGAGGAVVPVSSGSTFPIGTTTVTCSDTTICGDPVSCSFTVTVRPLPSVNPTATPASICAGASSTVCANASGGSGTFISYAWSNGATTSCITVSPSATTTYSVTVTDSNGCKGSGSATVTVTSNLTVSPTATPASICAGASSTVCANASGGSGTFTSYAWSNGATTSCITVTPSATTTYSVTVTDSNGCKGSGSATVTVNPLPTCSISGPSSVNAGSTGNSYTASTNAASPTFSWSISGNGSIVGSTTGSSVSVTAGSAGSFTLSVTITNGATGCKTTCTLPVTVNPVSCTPGITCPPNILVCLPAGVCSATGITITPTVSPNCPGATVTCVRSDGQPLTAPYPLGKTTVTCSVANAAGTVTGTCVTTVTVLSRGQNEVNVYVAAINGVPTTGTPDQVTMRVGDRLTLAMVVTIPGCGTFDAVATGLVTFSTNSALNLGTFNGNVFTAGPGAANKQFPIYGRFTNPCTGTTFTDTIHVTVRP